MDKLWLFLTFVANSHLNNSEVFWIGDIYSSTPSRMGPFLELCYNWQILTAIRLTTSSATGNQHTKKGSTIIITFIVHWLRNIIPRPNGFRTRRVESNDKDTIDYFWHDRLFRTTSRNKQRTPYKPHNLNSKKKLRSILVLFSLFIDIPSTDFMKRKKREFCGMRREIVQKIQTTSVINEKSTLWTLCLIPLTVMLYLMRMLTEQIDGQTPLTKSHHAARNITQVLHFSFFSLSLSQKWRL